jgi:hypothetical protein
VTAAPTPDDRLYSLVYSSRAVEHFDDAELATLLGKAREFNESQDISGMLLYRDGRFIQFLEGPEERVRHLMDDITVDPRHTDVRVLLDGHPTTRQFSDWTMGYEPIAAPTEPAPTGFRNTFDDLERIDDTDAVARAARELSLWFRVRAAGTATPRP